MDSPAGGIRAEPGTAVLGAPADAAARRPMEGSLGESIRPGARGGAMALAAIAAALLLMVWALARMVFADPTWGETIQLFALSGVLVWAAVGLASLSPLAHLATAAAFVAIGGYSLVAWLREPGQWVWLPAVAASAVMVQYVWKVRRLLRTPGRIRFELGVQPFARCEPIAGRAPQNALIELNNRIAESGRIRDLVREDVLLIEGRHRVRIARDLPAESQVLYARYLRHFLDDDFLNDDEKEEIAALERLLSLSAPARDAARREIATWLYSARVEEALHDGRVDAGERALLDRIVADLHLPPDEADRLFRQLAGERMASAVRAAAADQRLTDDEAAELEALSTHLGIPLERGAGGVSRRQLDRYRLLWRAERGPLPSVQPPLELAPDEVCHFQARASLRDPDSPRAARDDGTIAVTSRRLLFLGAAARVDVALADVGGIRPTPDGIEIQSGGERRLYTFDPNLAEADLFVQILGRAMRAAGAGA